MKEILNDVFYDYNHTEHNILITQIGYDLRAEENFVHTFKQENLIDYTIETEPESTHIRRSDRVRHIPNYFKDYHH